MLGVRGAWRIILVPAQGQIFNVSHFVLPEAAGMADYGQQPMLPELDKLVEYARLQVERERLRLEREQARAARKHLHVHEPQPQPQPQPQPSRPKHTYVPQNKALREYDTCRVAMLEYERAVREVVGAEGEVTPEAIYADAGGPSPKTQRRVMRLHGLRWGQDWPPSKWPPVAPTSHDRTN